MDKKQIQKALVEHHQRFIGVVSGLSESQFSIAPADKWTAGQHLEHIQLAVNPIAKALILPRFVLRRVLAKANRPSKTYEGLVEKYQTSIENGGKASGKFIPPPVLWQQRGSLIRKLPKTISNIQKRLDKLSESDLDNLVAPHPLLGKITLRELLYFTIYHVQHHQKLIQRDCL